MFPVEWEIIVDSYNPFDPIQDTERDDQCGGPIRTPRYNPFDPIQDTERLAGEGKQPTRVALQPIRSDTGY